MSNLVRTVRYRGVAVVTLVNPPVNAFSTKVRVALYEQLHQLREDASVSAVVLCGDGRGFSAGADIAEFSTGANAFADEVDPRDIATLIESYAKPVIAAIHGFALGGGLELAMACHWRLASPGAVLGLPEINLGLLPGAGGTVRLPRLVGVAKALDMMLSGTPVASDQASMIGLVDEVSSEQMVKDAVAFAERHGGQRFALSRVCDRKLTIRPDELSAHLVKARERAGSMKARRAVALRIIDCVENAAKRPFGDALMAERREFEACVRSAEARALQHGFFSERAAGRIQLPDSVVPREVERVGILGGGTMGRGIAMSFADAGYPVSIADIDASRAAAAGESIKDEYLRQVQRGRLDAEEAAQRASLITPVAGSAALASCDLVIEAVYEDLTVKLDACQMLGQVCRSGAIIASNTSTLDIDRLAEASGRPRDFIGLHFFSPANVMKLVEVVQGRQSSPEAVLTAVNVVRKLRKVPVISGVCWGFIGNRMLEPYLRETEALLIEGVAPSQIDRALEAFGMAMGPCRMMDLAGVDVVARVVSERARAGSLPDDRHYRVVSRELARIGRLGQKAAEGFYRYSGRQPIDDVDARSTVRALAQSLGVEQRSNVTDEEIVERCIFPLINEGYRVLEEGVATCASDVDVVWLTGYGFPRALGGPMFYAREIGPASIVAALHRYARVRGDAQGYWTPAQSLLDQAKAPPREQPVAAGGAA